MLETLIHSFVTSRLDFCNSLFIGLPKTSIDKIQTVQNACAKFLTGARKFDSATEQLKTLHWLPIKFRVQYKLMLLAHKIIYPKPETPIPSYIKDQIQPKSYSAQSRVTRSSLAPTLQITFKPKLVTVGNRSYVFSIPDLWNRLPNELRLLESFTVFKAKLKSFYFSQHFE